MNIEKEKLLKQLEKINKKKNMLEIINEGYVNENNFFNIRKKTTIISSSHSIECEMPMIIK